LGAARPGPDGIDTNVARLGWNEWRRATGGNDAMALFSRASMERWTRQNAESQRLDRLLGGAEKVLRYASLQEPILRLQEKLEELGRKRSAWINTMDAIRDNSDVAKKVFTPAELQHIEAQDHRVRSESMNLYEILPQGTWPGERPQQLSGLGAAPIVWLAVGAAAAIGYLAAVAAVITVINGALNDAAQRGILDRQQAGIETERSEALAQAQAERLAAEEIADPTERAAALQRVQSWWSGMTEKFDQMRADVRAASSELDEESKPPSENSGAILLGVGALVAGWAFLKK